jgi:hypothetical protein
MSAILDCALELALQKVRLFQVRPNSKIPAVTDFAGKATSDPEELTKLFGATDYNSGIACGRISENFYLVGFDIDNKDGRNGYETLELLAELGETFPETWAQKTPSGGEHRLFWSPVAIRQGTNVCGSGIDLRGEGGYLVGPGSTIGGVPYSVLRHLPIARFPQWAIDKWEKKATLLSLPVGAGTPVENQIFALKRSVDYLNSLEPAQQGSRNETSYVVAARLKDFGLAKDQIFEVMGEYWKCEPPVTLEELSAAVNNVFKYGNRPAGADAPENIFTAVPEEKTPIELMNENHFYYAANGVSRVCWETEIDGRFHLERFPVYTFHESMAHLKMEHNGKTHCVSKVWMDSGLKRRYDRLRFDPSNKLAANEYNTWRGFAVKAAASSEHPAVALFIDHCRRNVCDGDEELFKWFITFLAHIFQRPGEKPEVSLVFKGKKGTGKTIISEIINHLIGDNSVILSDKTHATGHFNSMMEDKLMVTLEEAFWSGDKSVEGILKDIVTGRTRVITHKGAEPYKAKVYDRIVIIGNEDWLVPATADERRFAVFNIADGNQQDRKFFGAMKRGIFDEGGDAALMSYLLAWPLELGDVNCAPRTKGLDEQKLQSLNVFQRWWFSCLQEGKVLGLGIEGWPEAVSCHDLYQAFTLQLQAERYKGHTPSKFSFGHQLKGLSPTCGGSKVFAGSVRKHTFSAIENVREEWDSQAGFKTKWD